MTNIQESKIKATYAVKANGFCAVLEFPNGGRMVGASRYRSWGEAQRDAEEMRQARLNYPEGCVPDPGFNQCIEL